MAAYTAAYSDIRINDTTRFRTQMGWIATQLETIGWTTTADTGQINWTTVNAPTTANESMGYEIRGSGEGLTLKVEYGSAGYAYAKSLWLTIGTGSDGAGTITGVLLNRTQGSSLTGYAGGSARAGDDYVAGDAERIMVAMTDDTFSGGYNGSFALQKTHNAALTEDTYGWWLLINAYNSSTLYCVGQKGIITATGGGLGVVRLPRSVGDASNIPTSPIFASHPLYGHVAMRDAYAVPASLMANQATGTINGRTYLSVGPNSSSATIWMVNMAFAHNYALRYE